MKTNLGVDIGGSFIRLGLFQGKRCVLQTKQELTKHPYTHIKDFLQNKKINTVCVAAAGPKKDGAIHMTNRKITLTASHLKKLTKAKTAHIINDFEAQAWGVLASNAHATPLNRAKPKPRAAKVIIGAGTGLGKAVMIFDEKTKHYQVTPSEAGHSKCPFTKRESNLQHFLTNKLKRAPEYEDIVSGRGIVALYDFVKRTKRKVTDVEKQRSTLHKSLMISKLRKTNTTCRKVHELFSIFYARFAQDTLLDTLPYGGLYLSGGIAIHNPDILRSKVFKQELYDSPFSTLLKTFPLYVITTKHLGLRGTGYCAVVK